jgi:hypothetical protein
VYSSSNKPLDIHIRTGEMGMPAKMENLHAPTVPSGPSSGPTMNGAQTNGLSFSQLQAKKDDLEAEIRALSSVLDSVRPIYIGNVSY